MRLSDYAQELALDTEPFDSSLVSDIEYQSLLKEVLSDLLEERGANREARQSLPESISEQQQWLQAILTERPATPFSENLWQKLDAIFCYRASKKSVVEASSLPSLISQFPETRYPYADKLALWQGDITELRIDAITNAANREMLGCFQPFHKCIDNAIHSASGPRLRDDCGRLMAIQSNQEETGQAKITRAYFLPSKFVLHTVGPIVPNHRPTEAQAAQLASCYTSCLDLCAELGTVRSVAFCCISTGVFGYPSDMAAKQALKTISQWLDNNSGSNIEQIVLNVFLDKDRDIYSDLIENWL